jgi:acyl-coenzyme A thioesterase PaaI-like protein
MALHHLLLRLFNLYPPYLGAGVRVRRLPDGFESRMTLRFYNRNYFGTHFGGSLYSMCDPFFALVLVERLGRGYAVWDKSAQIRFLRPGKGTVRARFEIPAPRVEQIRDEVDGNGRATPAFTVDVVDDAGEVVARLDKVLSVRRLRAAEPAVAPVAPTSPPPAAPPPPSRR